MRNSIALAISLVLSALFAVGCGGSNPLGPTVGPNPQNQVAAEQAVSNRVLWGLWECFMDDSTGRIEVAPLRTATFTANLNALLEAKPGNLQLSEIDLTDFLTEGRLDLTATIHHPLGWQDQFHGFDVWGVFLHNGASSLAYDGLTYPGGPEAGEDEAILLNADGYTRWYNAPEFDGDGQPMFEYWPGNISNLSAPTATLNGYKVFADGLGKDFDYYTWISSPFYANNRGVFRAGSVNSRRYQLRFPIIGGVPIVDFQYAILASWEPGDPSLTGNPVTYEPGDFPESANCDEAFLVHSSTYASDLYNDGAGQFGGSFRADIEVFDWQGGAVGGHGVPNEVERLIVEADFLPAGMVQYTHPELESIASPGTVNSSVFQVDIADCSPTSAGEYEFWIVVESAGLNGASYDQGFPSEFPSGARRASFQRDIVSVSDEAPFTNTPPVIEGIEDDIAGPGAYQNPITEDDEAVTYSAIFTDPDPGQTYTFTWWIVPWGQTLGPDYVVQMPVNWSNYDLGDYFIYVQVYDGFDATLGGPFEVDVIKGPIPEWGDPIVIDSQAAMPRAVSHVGGWGSFLVVYHKQDSGIMYVDKWNDTWDPPVIAYPADPSTMPGFMHITYGIPIVVGYEGEGEGGGNSHALYGPPYPDGQWEYMPCVEQTDLPSIMLLNDDDSYIHISLQGGSMVLTTFASWGSPPGPSITLPIEGEIEFSSTCFLTSPFGYHYVVFSRTLGDLKGVYRLTIPMSDPGGSTVSTVFESEELDAVDAPGMCLDGQGCHVAWKMSGYGNAWIAYSVLPPGGVWSAPVQVTPTFADWEILDSYVGVVSGLTDDLIYITYAKEPYIYMVSSTDGVNWSEPSSPYEGQLPLGFHWTQPYPIVTDDTNDLWVFLINKNEWWDHGALIAVEYN